MTDQPPPLPVSSSDDEATTIAATIARYANALVYGDSDAVGAVLELAARNPALDRAIADWHNQEARALQRRDDDVYAAIGDAVALPLPDEEEEQL